MKKSIVILILALLVCAPTYAQKKSKKNKKTPAAQPTLVTFVGADTNTTFVLYFAGKQINKKPASKVAVTTAQGSVGAEYNVRTVIKTPRLGSDMAWGSVTVRQQGEEYVVYANTRKDKAEFMTRVDYDKRNKPHTPKHKAIPADLRPSTKAVDKATLRSKQGKVDSLRVVTDTVKVQ